MEDERHHQNGGSVIISSVIPILLENDAYKFIKIFSTK
jgi:hypothetical protein